MELSKKTRSIAEDNVVEADQKTELAYWETTYFWKRVVIMVMASYFLSVSG